MNSHNRRYSLFALVIVLLVAACNTGGSRSANQPTLIPQDAVRVLFTYGSEKEAWIKAVTQSFNATNPRTAAGKPIVVEPVAIGSGESLEDILQGRTQPTLWSPASRIWLPIANDEWESRNNRTLLNEAECRDLVLSPVVIMMWRPMAEALGWPNTQIGWADLARIATSPNGWADLGRPQWGRFRWGHTHPDYSNSGLQAIVAMVYAATEGKRADPRRLTEADVRQPETQAFMRTLEGTIAHYGRSTGFFGTAMAQRGTSYLSAAVVYENVVVDNNNDPNKRRALDFPLVAIYPKEGTFQSDHPACILDAPWVNADMREAATVYRNYLLAEQQQQQALQFGFRPSDATIPLTAPITLDNGADPAQPQNTLAVPNARTIEAIRELWKAEKRSVNLTMLIDVSGSMGDNNRIQGAREGAAAFVDQLSDNDLLTLITFSSGQTMLFQDLPVGPNRERIKGDIRTLIAEGGTELYDGIAYAIDNKKPDPSRINALVVLSDGDDTESDDFPRGPAGVTPLMERYGMKAESTTDIAIFTIGYGISENQELQRVLRTIAERGRGAFRQGTSIEEIRNVWLDISTFF